MSGASLARVWYKVPYTAAMLLLGFRERVAMEARAAASGERPSVLEVAAAVVSDPYLLVFATTIAWLCYVAVSIPGARELIVQVRYGSRARWLAARTAGAGFEAAKLAGLGALAALAAGAGLRWSWAWGGIVHQIGGDQVLAAYARGGLSPAGALAGQTLLTALALTGLFVVAAAVSAFAARRGQLALATVLVGEFVGVLLLARADWAGAAAGLLLFFDARLPGWPLGVFGLDAAWPLAVVGTVAVVEWLTARRRLRVRPGVVFAVLAGGLTLAAVRPEDTGSLADCLTALFYGASRDGIGLGPYALHQIVFLGVPFLALWEAERSDLPRLALLAVRHGSLGPWLGRVLGRWALAGAAVVGGTVVLAAGLVAAGGGRLATAGLGPVLRQHALNGLLQVWVSTLLVLGVLLVTGSDRVAFGALAALVLLGLPQLTRGWFPAGLGMIGHLGDPSFDPAAATAVLAGTVSILALAACAGAMWRPACRYLTGRIHESH